MAGRGEMLALASHIETPVPNPRTLHLSARPSTHRYYKGDTSDFFAHLTFPGNAHHRLLPQYPSIPEYCAALACLTASGTAPVMPEATDQVYGVLTMWAGGLAKGVMSEEDIQELVRSLTCLRVFPTTAGTWACPAVRGTLFQQCACCCSSV